MSVLMVQVALLGQVVLSGKLHTHMSPHQTEVLLDTAVSEKVG